MAKTLFNPKIHEKDKMFGTTTMGARGQVVIPAEARKELNIKPGDRMIVMGKFGKVLALMKTGEIEEFVGMMMDVIQDEELKEKFSEEAAKLLHYSKAN